MAGSARGFNSHGRAQAAERKEMAMRDVAPEHRSWARAMGIKARPGMSLHEAVSHALHENEHEYMSFATARADKKSRKMWQEHMREGRASVVKVRPKTERQVLKEMGIANRRGRASGTEGIPF